MAQIRDKRSRQSRSVTKLYDAFWELLKDYSIDDMNIRLVTEKANCNRGTFYYHFNTFTDFVISAAQQKVLSKFSLYDYIFSVVSDKHAPNLQEKLSPEVMDDLSLFLRHGGRDITEEVFRSNVVELWSFIIHPEGGTISTYTELLLEYLISGILGVLSQYTRFRKKSKEAILPSSFVEGEAEHLMRQACEFEGVEFEYLKTRIIENRDAIKNLQ